MLAVTACDEATAANAGRMIETVMPSLSLDVVKRALRFSHHSTRIMQDMGGLHHVCTGDSHYIVDVDEINSLTGFDPADIDTFL